VPMALVTTCKYIIKYKFVVFGLLAKQGDYKIKEWVKV